jgi:glyoxylase-like metal-dependent hydrolase (beta-lactamase superfamily II)
LARLSSDHTHWERTHPRTSWFDVRELEPGVHLVGEPGHVNSFLVQGSKSAVLVDTGLGVADIRAVARELTDKPLLVVNSHYHFDHTGGNGLFEQIAIHRLGAPLLEQATPDGYAELYMEYTRRVLEAWGPYKKADDLYFHLITAERLVRPLPQGFDPGAYRIAPSKATRLLEDGDVLDLGGRRLEVLHTPGHSPDCICLVDRDNGLLFGGDTVNTGPVYAQYEESSLPKFAESLGRLAAMRSDLRRVFVCHYLRLENEPSLLAEMSEGFQRILAGDVALRDNLDCFGEPVKEACFDHFSVFVGYSRKDEVRRDG